MKAVPFVFVLFLTPIVLNAQSFKKYTIGSAGCAVYMFCNPGEFETTYSEDSSVVYTAECKADSISYGLICVKLKETVTAGAEAEQLMTYYLDYLKTALKIKSAVGYGKGHTMEKKPEARGMIDYWTDESGNEWKVKAWSDGKFLAVLYVYATGKLNYEQKHDVYLNSFRFPGM